MKRVFTLAAALLLVVPVAGHAGSGAFLGITLGRVDEELAKKMGNNGRGVYVLSVVGGSGAEKAGVKDHDVIVEIDGDRIAGPGHLGELLDFYSPGDKVSVKVWRDGKTRTLRAELGERTVKAKAKIAILKGGPKAWLGVTVQSLTGQLAEHFGAEEGVLISSVVNDSPAEQAGLKAGDVITTVDDEGIEEPIDLPSVISKKDPGAGVTIALVRDGEKLTKKVKLGETPEEHRGKVRVFAWDEDDDEKLRALTKARLRELEGLEGLECLKALDILKFPLGPLPPGIEIEVRDEMDELKGFEESLREEMEELRRELEELKKALKESK